MLIHPWNHQYLVGMHNFKAVDFLGSEFFLFKISLIPKVNTWA